MKKFLFIAIILASSTAFSQTIINRESPFKWYSENSEIRVIEDDGLSSDFTKGMSIAFILDGMLVDETTVRRLNPLYIEKINVEKEKYIIEGKEYVGKVDVTLKPEFSPNFMTLKALTDKYLELDDQPFIVQVDDDILHKDLTEYVIDEKYILKIIRSKVNTSQDGVKVNFIQIITKTPENISKANEVIIKGSM